MFFSRFVFVLFWAYGTCRLAGAVVQCNATVAENDHSGTCSGDYCFNMEDKILGCLNFYRLIRDDNIACGHMHLLGANRYVCVCTQPYCGKYETANMPQQTLATVNCTDDTSDAGYCTPGPCYVGNDLARYGKNATDHPVLQRTCMQDWFAVTNFNELIVYEVPPLKGHSACFFDGNTYNCMCKDPGCNQAYHPSSDPSTTDTYSTCHKAQCTPGVDAGCDENYHTNDTCVGQLCYYLNVHYNFTLDTQVYNKSLIVRDCLNYSHDNPLEDLTFSTGFEFGSTRNYLYPCRGDYCSDKPSDQTTTVAPPTTASTGGAFLALASPILMIFALLLHRL